MVVAPCDIDVAVAIDPPVVEAIVVMVIGVESIVVLTLFFCDAN